MNLIIKTFSKIWILHFTNKPIKCYRFCNFVIIRFDPTWIGSSLLFSTQSDIDLRIKPIEIVRESCASCCIHHIGVMATSSKWQFSEEEIRAKLDELGYNNIPDKALKEFSNGTNDYQCYKNCITFKIQFT